MLTRSQVVWSGQALPTPGRGRGQALEYQGKKGKTRRELFLERMDGLIPWQLLEDRLHSFYPRPGWGRHPHPLSVLLRVHCVRLCYNLRDPGMEDLLYKSDCQKWESTRPRPSHRVSRARLPTWKVSPLSLADHLAVQPQVPPVGGRRTLGLRHRHHPTTWPPAGPRCGERGGPG